MKACLPYLWFEKLLWSWNLSLGSFPWNVFLLSYSSFCHNYHSLWSSTCMNVWIYVEWEKLFLVKLSLSFLGKYSAFSFICSKFVRSYYPFIHNITIINDIWNEWIVLFSHNLFELLFFDFRRDFLLNRIFGHMVLCYGSCLH